MIFDYNLFETLRLNATSRWGIVQMNRTQSVAEHTFGVATIALHLASKVNITGYQLADLMVHSLTHDLDEIYSGDIPASEKGSFSDALDDWHTAMFPKHCEYKNKLPTIIKQLVKVADLMEAIIYARRHCIDVRRESIINGLEHDLHCFIWNKLHISTTQRAEVAKAVGELWQEERTR